METSTIEIEFHRPRNPRNLKKNSSKKYLWIAFFIIVVIFALIALIAIGFWIKKLTNASDEDNESETMTTTMQPPTEKIPNPAESDWNPIPPVKSCKLIGKIQSLEKKH